MEGVIAAEGYHAGGVRELLIQQAGAVVPPYGLSMNQVAQVSDKITFAPIQCNPVSYSTHMCD